MHILIKRMTLDLFKGFNEQTKWLHLTLTGVTVKGGQDYKVEVDK